jgi:hypothetical protein
MAFSIQPKIKICGRTSLYCCRSAGGICLTTEIKTAAALPRKYLLREKNDF